MTKTRPPWQRWLDHIGALPTQPVTWGLVLFFSVWVVLDVFVFKVTGGLANSSFDAMVRARVYVAAPDPRIVIIDIDEASLARMTKEFGRWPWPRDTLATVLDHVEGQGPAAVVWDILFSDADRISPGGDTAFNEAVRRSEHSHFSVVRLPKMNDKLSEVTGADLPNLWVAPPLNVISGSATVALIPPALPAIAASRLGFNNGYADSDGVLRRYRYLEPLVDGSAIQSLPLSVLRALDPSGYQAYVAKSGRSFVGDRDELIAWRREGPAYPHISFADVFDQADGGKPLASVPNFAGKIVIVGSTAPSLHDIHATPLFSMQAGVDSLAAALDNLLNQRHLAELPRWLQAFFAVALCVGLAVWGQLKSIGSLAPALLVLPAALLGMSYLSLNGSPMFIDLHLAAGLALLFLALLRYWNMLRRNYWCSTPAFGAPLAIWPLARQDAWSEGPLDRLIDAVERYAPDCRVVVCDFNEGGLATPRWPELARFAAVVGPQSVLTAVRSELQLELGHIASRYDEPVLLEACATREALADGVLAAWHASKKTDVR
ncbi:MAG: CHASE2 domain-containing protein [Polaromonas sp.]|nr:CHASE2 domain-containing protein [Polaromonas sp.]